MDDVLTQTNTHWISEYNKEWDDDRTLEHIKGWNIHYWVKPECGKDIYDYLKRPGFYRNLTPVVGAIEGTKTLMERGHDVVIATASPIGSDTAVEEKKNWVREHMPFFDLTHMMPMMHLKHWLAADVMLDDGTHNLKDFTGISICMDKPWNRGEPWYDLRITGWAQFMTVVKDIHKFDGSTYKTLKKRSIVRLERRPDVTEEWRYDRG